MTKLEERATAYANTVPMTVAIDEITAKLIRDSIVLGYVQGTIDTMNDYRAVQQRIEEISKETKA